MRAVVARAQRSLEGGSALTLDRQRNPARSEKALPTLGSAACLRLYRRAKEATCQEPWPVNVEPLRGNREHWVVLKGVPFRVNEEQWEAEHAGSHDHERARREACRRACTKLRRYVRHHRCKYLWTFTYAAPQRDLADVKADVEKLEHQLRRHFGHVPAVVVAEPHPGGHGWHLHLATDRFLDVNTLRATCWQHGRVNVSAPGKLGAHTAHPRRGHSPKKLASYLTKYVRKGFEDDASAPAYNGVCGHDRPGRRRYWCTRGPRGQSFVPQPEVHYVADRDEGRILGAVLLGVKRIACTIHLDRKEDYCGPPGCWIDYW